MSEYYEKVWRLQITVNDVATVKVLHSSCDLNHPLVDERSVDHLRLIMEYIIHADQIQSRKLLHPPTSTYRSRLTSQPSVL